MTFFRFFFSAAALTAAGAAALLVSAGPATAASGSVTYTYDSLGRLVQSLYPSSGQAETYVYDNAGNRTNSTTK